MNSFVLNLDKPFKEDSMSREKRKILEMLSAKKITVDEAERLLSALGESSGSQEVKGTGLHSR